MAYVPGLLPLYLVLYTLVFFLGAALASFAGVVADRLPRGQSFVRGRSFCPKCRATLTPRDLVPVFSWLLLRGRCRHCGAAIPPRHPLTEALGGLLSALALWRFGLTLLYPAALALLMGLLAAALIDHDTMEIPDGLHVFLFFPAAALAVLTPETGWLSHVIGVFAVSVPLLVLTHVIEDSFGGADVKLMAVCGLGLGWQLILLALFVALITGGGYGIRLLATGRAKKGAHIAFGPHLAAGVAVALLFGGSLLGLYGRFTDFLGGALYSLLG